MAASYFSNGSGSAPSLLDLLIESLRCLPGVGPKSAQRMAFHLLQRNRDGAKTLADTLSRAIREIGHCKACRIFSEHEYCSICLDASRIRSKICVVESPADVLTIEKSTDYKGLYFVLMGRLSPLDGIGPKELGLNILEDRLKKDTVEELILATNSTVEGEVTAHVLSEIAGKQNVQTTRLAQGVPIGGELEFVDQNTIAQAFAGRKSY
ncbi:MAG: recombination mediator RecR [Gammaproteobacteria bacterium]|nr:recombination mediator RecR [Gammaproteobacteria bacterium]